MSVWKNVILITPVFGCAQDCLVLEVIRLLSDGSEELGTRFFLQNETRLCWPTCLDIFQNHYRYCYILLNEIRWVKISFFMLYTEIQNLTSVQMVSSPWKSPSLDEFGHNRRVIPVQPEQGHTQLQLFCLPMVFCPKEKVNHPFPAGCSQVCSGFLMYPAKRYIV